MSGISKVLEYIKEVFPEDFRDARIRQAHEPFDLNALRISDLIFIPSNLHNLTLGQAAQQNTRDDSLKVNETYMAVFLFSRPIDKNKTFRSIATQLMNTPKTIVEINRTELNPTIILKRIFDKETADPSITVFAIWITVRDFYLKTKENCGICYTNC